MQIRFHVTFVIIRLIPILEMDHVYQLHARLVKLLILVKMFVLFAKAIIQQTIVALHLLHHQLDTRTQIQTGQIAIGQNWAKDIKHGKQYLGLQSAQLQLLIIMQQVPNA